MAHAIEHQKGCPDTEIWCGYLDGAIQGEEKAQLAAHLEGCDPCFEDVASIQAALIKAEEEEELLETPDLLLKKGQKLISRPGIKPVWKLLSYAAAACLLLGIAFWIHRSFFLGGMPIPSAEKMYAALQHALEGDERSMPQGLDGITVGGRSSALYGFSGTHSTEASSFNVGRLFADLEMGLGYLPMRAEGNLENLKLLSNELAGLDAPKSLLNALRAIGSEIRAGRYSKKEIGAMFGDLYADADEFIEHRGSDTRIYLRTGAWVEGLRLVAQVVKHTGGVTARNQLLFQQSEAVEYLLEYFRAADVARGVTKSLEQLAMLSKKTTLTDEDINTILSETENLQRLLS